MRSLVAVRHALKTYWGTAALMLLTGSVALASVLPVTALVGFGGPDQGTRLALSTVRGSGLGLEWNAATHPAAAIQQAAAGRLFELLLTAGVATLAIAALTILALSGARASVRESEITVRRAVGASRRTLISAAILEALLIAGAALGLGSAGGAAGGLIARAAWPGALTPGGLTPSLIAAAALAAAILLGAILPLLFARTRRVAEAGGNPVPLYLPALQLGLCLTVLVTSTQAVRLATRLATPPPEPQAIGQIFELSGTGGTPVARSASYAVLLDQLTSDARFETVSLTSPGAIVGLGTVSMVTTDCGRCFEGTLMVPWHLRPATHQLVSADSFRALGVRLVEGRGIAQTDQWDSARVAVVSRALAARHFQNGQALGRALKVGDDADNWYTVVGVADDRPAAGFGGALLPEYTVYLSILQHPASSVDLLVRPWSGAEAGQVEARARQALAAIDPDPRTTTESGLVAREAAPLRWFGRWLGLEGWAMLLLATLGTFVLLRLWVVSLLPELGVRRAVGARRRHLLGFVLSRAVLTGLGGVALGLWFGPGLWAIIPSVMAGTDGWDGGALVRYGGILVLAAAAGAMMPGWWASRKAPMELISWSGE